VPAPTSFEYAAIRVVPRVERGEFLNAGVIVYCLARDFLEARVELDARRLLALWPGADVELVLSHLEAIPRVCAGGDEGGPIGRLPQKERWHWLVAPRSTLVQVGPVHAGLCQHPTDALEGLLDTLVRVPGPVR
jgi:Protein of unknown function (DUF3037)